MDARDFRQFAAAARGLSQQDRAGLARKALIHALAGRATPYPEDERLPYGGFASPDQPPDPYGGMGPPLDAVAGGFVTAAPGAISGAYEWDIASPDGGVRFPPAAPQAPQPASADAGPMPASGDPFRPPAAADSGKQKAARAGASADKPDKSEEELARERVCRFALARPWGKNQYAFSAEEIVRRYKPGKRAGDPFPGPEEAVKAALSRFQSDRNEYLAIILRFTEGPYKNQFTWSCLQRGYRYSRQEARKLGRADKGVDVPGNVSRLARVDGTKVYAWAHTHGTVSGTTGLDRFKVSGRSDCDRTVTKITGIKGYLLRRGRVEEIEPGYEENCIRKEKTGRSGSTGAAFARPGEHCARRSGRGGDASPD